MTREVYLIIPNSDIGGAQNFFKRLFNNFEVGNKELVIEEAFKYDKINEFNKEISKEILYEKL